MSNEKSSIKINWIKSNGGAFVIMGRGAASSWKGVNGLSLASDDIKKTDYDLACRAGAYAAIVEGSSGKVLSINDLPNDLMVYSNSKTEVVIVKWVGADSDEQILSSLRQEECFHFRSINIEFAVSENNLVAFDSALINSDLDSNNTLLIELDLGCYGVEVAEYEPNDSLVLQLYRLKLLKRLVA